ncbi:MAG: phosphatidylglycerophosphatase A [Planctomycetota bacterium]
MRTAAGDLSVTFFGTGFCPVAPGTAGSLAALGLAWLLERAGGRFAVAAGALALAVLCVALASYGVRRFGVPDPGPFVLDEAAAVFLLVAAAAPAAGMAGVFVAFVLFRILDALKPFPISRLERLPGGFGILFDDLAAAAAAVAPTWGVSR